MFTLFYLFLHTGGLVSVITKVKQIMGSELSVYTVRKYYKVLYTVGLYKANNLLHLCDDNNQSISIQEGAEGVTAAWLAKRNVINKIPTTTFHSHNFKQIMAYLLQKSQTKYVFNI
jgi:hypothetical protein